MTASLMGRMLKSKTLPPSPEPIPEEILLDVFSEDAEKKLVGLQYMDKKAGISTQGKTDFHVRFRDKVIASTVMSQRMKKGFREGFAPLNADHWRIINDYESSTGRSIEEIDEFSAGCIVFSRNEEGKLVVMMIEQGRNWYNFPKGHVEEGEEDIEAAIRETLEETGIVVKREEMCVVEPIFTQYSLACKLHSSLWEKHPDYPNKKKRPYVIGHKRVTFYCAYIPEIQVGVPQPGEALSVRWFTIDEARATIDEVIAERFQDALNTNFVQSLLASNTNF